MYKLTNNMSGEASAVFRISDNTSIPFDPANTDYQAYLAWLSAGNQPLSADADAEGNQPIPAEPEPQPE